MHKRLKTYEAKENQDQILTELVVNFRKSNSNYGGRKLHHLLKQEMELRDIKMGRDKFFTFLKQNKLLVKRHKSYHITTNSNHRFYKYPNIIKDYIPSRPEQIWVSDITYIKTQTGHNYLALVTDAYSKRIMGYAINNHMKASLCVDALKMAISNRQYASEKLIHHSDRGFQYCSTEYTNFTKKNKISLSMTEQYDPYENAIAERINRTLKYEYALKNTIKDLNLVTKMVDFAVRQYNEKRPHFSLDLFTPNHVHRMKNIKCKSYKKDKSNLKVLEI